MTPGSVLVWKCKEPQPIAVESNPGRLERSQAPYNLNHLVHFVNNCILSFWTTVDNQKKRRYFG